MSIPLIEDKLGATLGFSSETRDGFQDRIDFVGPDPVGAFPSQPDVFPIEGIVSSALTLPISTAPANGLQA